MNKLLDGIVLSTFLLFSAASCDSKKNVENDYSTELKPTGTIVDFPLDSNTVAETTSLFSFVTNEGVEYLAFLNRYTNNILFYNVNSQQLDHKIVFNREGPNSTGYLSGFTIINKDSIIAVIYGRTILYLVDWKGEVKKKIDFSRSSFNEPLLWTDGYSFFYSPVIYTKKKLYLTQEPIHSDKICVEIDLDSDSIKLLPMIHPDRDPRDVENNMFCRDFDGKNFIYSFRLDHNIHITENHNTTYTKPAKSDWISRIVPVRFRGRPSIEEGWKAVVETPQYRSIVYDSYRDVYYRFAYPGVRINEDDNLKIIAKHYKKFSVIILDKNFSKVGEYFTPENTYNMNMFFVGKEGLYLSTNHLLNPKYDENKLSFELLKFNTTKK